MNAIEIMPMIHRELKRSHYSHVEFARKLNANPSTVQAMLERKTLQVEKLVRISEVFQYNFFREIAAMLPYTKPDYTAKPTVDTEKEELKERVKALEIEVNVLRQMLKDVIAR